jgi:S1-C subfamily serine protease
MKVHPLRFALLILALTCLAPQVLPNEKTRKVKVPRSQIKQADRQLVKIEVKMVPTKHLARRSNWVKWLFTDKVTKIGNGYYIEPNRVVTNYHVINATLPKELRWVVGLDQEDPLTVLEIKVNYHKVKVIRVDPVNDLAELEVESKNPKSKLPEANAQPSQGGVVYSVNRDLNGIREVSLGEVIGPFTLAVFKDGAYEPTDVNPKYRLPPNMTLAPVLGLRLNAARGWSGCWVFDLDGKFLGIVRAAHHPTNLALLVPAEMVTRFLQNVTTASVTAEGQTAK